MAGVLTVKIVGESRDAVAAIDHVDGKLGRLSGVASGVGRAVAGAAVAATAGVVAAGAFAVSSVRSASDLAETVSKSNVIFGQQAAAGLMNLAEAASTSLGMSERAFLEYASGYGNMLVSIGGLTQEAAAKQAAELTTLTADIASFNNATTAEVSAAVNSALTGEFEPLKKYGVVINDATLKAKALELGLLDSSGAMSAQAKQAATLALVYEQTGTAQGDFAETSGGAANQAKILAAQFENLKSDLGQKLLPVAVAVFSFLNEMFPKVAAIAGPALDTVVGAVKAFIAAFKADDGDITSSGLAGQMERFGFIARNVFEKVQKVVGTLVEKFREAWPEIQSLMQTAAGVIATVFGIIVAAAEDLIPVVVAVAEGIMSFVGFLRDNPQYLIAFGIGIATVLVPAFIAWAVASAAAAVATIAATLPVIAIIAAVTALAAGVIWAYQNLGWFQTAVDAVASFLKDTLWPILKTIVDWYLAYAGAVIGAGKAIYEKLIPAVSAIVGWFGTLITRAGEVVGSIKGGFNDVVGFIAGLPDRITTAASGMFDGIKDAFRSAINWIIGKWNSLSFSMPEVDTKIPGVGKVGGWSLDTPNIREFHSGGIVPGIPGQEVLALLLAGERVLPPGESGTGINIGIVNVVERPWLDELVELESRYGVLA